VGDAYKGPIAADRDTMCALDLGQTLMLYQHFYNMQLPQAALKSRTSFRP
jgi:hypothetical protein